MDRSRDWTLVAAAVLAVAVWLALRSWDQRAQGASPQDEAAVAVAADTGSLPNQPVALTEGSLAPDLTLETLAGEQVSLSDYRGKVVLVNFWASWCGPCRIEIPHLTDAYDELEEQGLEILAVNVGERADEIRSFADTFDMRFPVLLDSDMAVARSYALRGLPTNYLVDQEGIIRVVRVGMVTESMLREHLTSLAKEDE